MESHNLNHDSLEIINHIQEQKIISLNKFIILCIASFGLYQIWWVYKAWCFFQQKERTEIHPAARTIFSIFFLIPLFNRIYVYAKEKGYCPNYSSIILFIGIVLTQLLSKLPDPYWLFSLLDFVFLIPVFNALNYAKKCAIDYNVVEETKFNGWQITIILIGMVFWTLVISSFAIQ